MLERGGRKRPEWNGMTSPSVYGARYQGSYSYKLVAPVPSVVDQLAVVLATQSPVVLEHTPPLVLLVVVFFF